MDVLHASLVKMRRAKSLGNSIHTQNAKPELLEQLSPWLQGQLLSYAVYPATPFATRELPDSPMRLEGTDAYINSLQTTFKSKHDTFFNLFNSHIATLFVFIYLLHIFESCCFAGKNHPMISQ